MKDQPQCQPRGRHLDPASRSPRHLRDEFRTIADSTRDWEFWLTPDGQFLYVSPSCERITGYQPAEFIASPALFYNIACPEQSAMWSAAMERAFAQGAEDGLDCQITRKQGTSIWVSLAFQPMRDKHGVFVGVRGSVRDISERKQMEEALRRAHEDLELRVAERTAQLREANAILRYQAHLLANVHEAIVATDVDGRVTAWNPAATDLFGGPAEEALGQPLENVLHLQFEDISAEQATSMAAEAGCWQGEVSARATQGTPLCLESTITALRDEDDRITGYVTSSRDISSRKLAERSLREHAQRLQGLYEIAQAILAVDSEQEIAQVAAVGLRRMLPYAWACVAVYDFEADEARLLALDAAGQTRLHAGQCLPLGLPEFPDGPARDQTEIDNDLQAQSEPSPFTRLLLEDGIRARLRVPILVKGKLIGSLSLAARTAGAFDTSTAEVVQQVAALASVAIQNARLLEEVQRHSDGLRTLARRLVDVQENERQAIARELHDESGQALTSLIIGLGLLQRQGDCPETIRTGLEDLKLATQRVMDGLHDLAMHLRPISLEKLGLVPALHQYLTALGPANGLSVHFETMGLRENERLPSEVETAIYRVVQEAVTNILRHAQATEVNVVLQHWADRTVVITEDDGTGFDVHQAMQRGRVGLLGMRERVETLGGTLEIESTPGNGTTVSALIPGGPGLSEPTVVAE